MIPKLNNVVRAGLSEAEQRLLRRLKSQPWFYDVSGLNPPKEAEQATHLTTVLKPQDVAFVRDLINKLDTNNVIDGSRIDDQDPSMVKLILTKASAHNLGIAVKIAAPGK